MLVDDNQASQTGEGLFETFVEQVKQTLEHLYDFAYLQQHSLARIYDGKDGASAKTAGRQLRHDLIKAIESLKPRTDAHFRAPDARLYNVLHMCYVENLSIQEVATELGLSERQAYRDLKRGQENVAAALWNNRFPPSAQQDASEFSLQSEVARLKLDFSPTDVGAIFQQALSVVERLAVQQSVDISVETPVEPLMLSTNPALAHQIIVSLLSHTIQQIPPGVLSASFETSQGAVTLTLRYLVKEAAVLADSAILELAQRLRWTLTYQDLPGRRREVTLHMASSKATILIIDDSEGWIGLLERYLEASDCLVVAAPGNQDSLRRAQELKPDVIILDVMMPDKDGWELLQRLRAQPATANVPIIVCTVFNDPQLAYSLGASAFLAKPTSREQILDTLKQLDIIV